MKLLVLVSVLLIAAVGTAQNYSVDWYKISGGGGSCSGGTYTLTSTIGQHDATVMTGGRYSLVGGFWAIITAVQTPGAPALYVASTSNNVSIYWNNVPAWTLQQNTVVNDAAGWSPAAGVTTTNGTNYLNITLPAGNRFFRLNQH